MGQFVPEFSLSSRIWKAAIDCWMARTRSDERTAHVMHRNRGKRMKLMSRFGDDGGDEARMAEQNCVFSYWGADVFKSSCLVARKSCSWL